MLTALLVQAAVALAQNRPATSALVLEHVTVIDVEHGTRRRDQRVVLEGTRIRALGPARIVPLPPGARRIEAQGKYLIPGLWDLHIHPGWDTPPMAATYPRADAIYQELIANGITGIRDAGNAIPLDTLRAWERAVAAGRRVGPRMIVSGPSIEFARGSRACRRDDQGACIPRFQVYIARPEEAEFIVDSLKTAGADMIKIHQVPRPIWFAIAAAARRAGMTFGGHFQRNDDSLPSTVDGLVASDSGARILDHYLWVDACGYHQDSLESLPQCVAAGARLRRSHTWFTTDGPGEAGPDLAVSDSFRTRALRYAPLKRTVVGQDYDAWRPLTAAERRQEPSGADWVMAVPDSVRQGRDCQRARLAYAADLPWLPGPDLPLSEYVPGVHLTLLRPVLCGVPPLWALRAATLEPARALGLTDSLGTVAAGKVADLVLLEGDPLDDIWNVTKIAAVVANGRYFDRAALDHMLAAADAEWRQVITAAKRAETHP